MITLVDLITLSTRIGPSIKRIRTAKGLTLDQVATHVGVSKATISKIENGKQGLSVELIDRLAVALDVPVMQIYTDADRNGVESTDVKGTVPLISWVQAGAWNEAIDNLQPGQGERVATTYKAKERTYALRVRNDSMEPKFPEGCTIIVEPDDDPTPGKYVIVRQNGNEATFKQLMRDGDKLYLKPLNPRYPIMPLEGDAVFCGVVKKIEMDV